MSSLPIKDGLNLPVAQPQSANREILPALVEGGDFDPLMALLSSLPEAAGENPAAVAEQWLQQQAQLSQEQPLDESAMAAITAWIDGLVSQQEQASHEQPGDGQTTTVPLSVMESLSSVGLSMTASPSGSASYLNSVNPAIPHSVSQPVPMNTNTAVMAAMDQLPEMGALYTSSLKKTDSDEKPVADLDSGTDLNKVSVPERAETAQSLRLTDRLLFPMPAVVSDSAMPVPPSVNTGLTGSVTAADGRLATASQSPSTADVPRDLPLKMTGEDDDTWGNALSQRLMTLVGDKVKEAHIRLDPPELGQLGIKVVVEDDHLKIRFTAAHPLARELLEGQSERLRSAFDGSGFARVDIDVRQQGSDQNERQQTNGFTERTDTPGDESGNETTAEPMPEMVTLPIQTALDVFA